MLLIGLDPGGVRQFGWCVANDRGAGPVEILESGVADNAYNASRAFAAVVNRFHDKVVAAGIDSPLFWSDRGDRKVDSIVRNAIEEKGAPHAHGTVQNVNSLRGACVVQGVLGAHLLLQMYPEIAITESHPKALLWLLGIANEDLPTTQVGMQHLRKYASWSGRILTVHERDAVLGAVTASAMVRLQAGWNDIVVEEDSSFTPVEGVRYYMPIMPIKAR